MLLTNKENENNNSNGNIFCKLINSLASRGSKMYNKSGQLQLGADRQI